MIVFIPCAGKGERVKSYSFNFNKTLIPYNNKPVISHIIDSYPKNYKFIIGLGYRGNIIKNYLNLAYPNKKILFYKVSTFEGKKASLTRTIKEGLKYINEPFIFHANDMIVDYKVKEYANNFALIDNKNKDFWLYRYFKINGKKKEIFEKQQSVLDKNNHFPYLGIAFIKDYLAFKKIISNSKKKIGEVEFFQSNISYKLVKCKSFLDFGNPQTNEELNKNNFLDKKNETIYFLNNKVFKYCSDKEKNIFKYKRSLYIKKFLPLGVKQKNEFLIYNFQKGNLLNQNYKPLKQLLNYLYNKFWFNGYSKRSDKVFQKNCFKFYHDKTFSRLKLLDNLKQLEKIKKINGFKIKSVFNYLKQINWSYISEGMQCNFHGDLHGSNIIHEKNKFTLIDWREKFGDDIRTGDIYYDLAKIYHGLIVNHEFIRKNQFKIKINNGSASIYPKINKNLILGNKIFWKFIYEKKFDEKKIILITALIFINISPLHNKHYKSFLFLLGKYMLATNEKFKFTNISK